MAIEVKQNDKEFELWYDDLHLGSSKLRCDAELVAKQLRRKVDEVIDRTIKEMPTRPPMDAYTPILLQLLEDPEFINRVKHKFDCAEVLEKCVRACQDLQNINDLWKLDLK